MHVGKVALRLSLVLHVCHEFVILDSSSAEGRQSAHQLVARVHSRRRWSVDACETQGVLINVWVAAWQMQCCGSPFADGDVVEWTLSQNDVAWLKSVVGDDAARSVEFSWEKHGPLPEGSATTKGVVGGIQAVRCKLAPTAGGDPKMLYPVGGSGQLKIVHSADGWDRDADGLRFHGYIVTLDVAT